MAKRSVAIAEQREPLTKGRVLRTAIRLADEGGIQLLTMRKLAAELGIEAMSLYHYVASKDDLLAGMLEIAMNEIEPPLADGEWKVAIRATATSYYAALRRHRWAHEVMSTPSRVSLAQVRYMDALLARLRAAGFSARMTHHAYHALDSHIIGTALWMAGIAAAIPKGRLPDVAQAVLQRVPVAEYPAFHEHVQVHLTKAAQGDKNPFEFGLDLILDGLDELRDEAPPSTPVRRPYAGRADARPRKLAPRRVRARARAHRPGQDVRRSREA